jgi:hypothetical protein
VVGDALGDSLAELFRSQPRCAARSSSSASFVRHPPKADDDAIVFARDQLQSAIALKILHTPKHAEIARVDISNARHLEFPNNSDRHMPCTDDVECRRTTNETR